MDEVIPRERACRDFRSKFPDDVLQENLAGQLWFGAEVQFITFIFNYSSNNFQKFFYIAVLSCWVEYPEP